MTNIDEVRGLLAKATPGKFTLDDGLNIKAGDGYSATNVQANFMDYRSRNKSNAQLLVAAVNALPGLLDEVERLRVIERRLAEASVALIGTNESCVVGSHFNDGEYVALVRVE